MKTSDRDRQILRDLAKQVAELAAAPEQEVLRRLWRRHNDLQGERVMVVAYIHDTWPEFFSLQIEEPLLRGWEWTLRHTIHLASLGTDEIITTHFPIAYVVRNKDYGIPTRIIQGSGDSGRQEAYTWEPPLKKVEDLKKLVSGISVDFKASEATYNIARDLFGDILDVQLDGGFGCSFDEKAAFLRGMSQIMLDMYDTPEFLHELMAFIRDETMNSWKYAEEHGLLSRYESSNWAFTDQLPTGKHLKICDLQGGQAAQAFVGVSPRLFEEFLFRYQKPVLDLFGQTFYGCCEPLHDKIDIIKQLKNLRRVSISPWANLKISAEKLQDKYIFSWKPHPAVMAAERFDVEEISTGLREALAITRGCHLEIIMKDVTTTNHHPERLKTWVEIARQAIG